jgi:alpha-ribazole phosphatase
MEIYLIRHTRVDVVTGLCYGRTEVPLASTFAAEVAELRAWLPAFDRLFSSPADRCRRLATSLCEDVQYEERLLELDFGIWEGRTWSDIDGPEARAWGDDFVDSPCPGGESYAELATRVIDWQKQLPMTDGRIGVVTHGGPIRALLATLLELPLAKSFRFVIDCGGVSLLRPESGHWTAKFVNRHG